MSSPSDKIPSNSALESTSRFTKRKRDETQSTDTATDTQTLASLPAISQVKSDINPNFDDLAAAYPDFKVEWHKLRHRQKSKIGKKDASSFSANVDFDFNLALTRAILDKHFQLNLKCMPKGYLCPPVPNRLNYVSWLKDLLRESSHEAGQYFESPTSTPIVRRGLDLGTGASCIYPLLLTRREFTGGKPWQFLGTDIDPYSIKCAQENIVANLLQNEIKLAIVSPREGGGRTTAITDVTKLKEMAVNNNAHQREITTPLYTAMKAAHDVFSEDEIRFDFCMTNPPFYSNTDEATMPRSGDERNRTDMTFNESVYPGGEVGFALDMMHDSFAMRHEITWYTLMLSKKSSLIFLEKELAALGFHRGSIRTTEFVQGKMIRWGLAWTFLSSSPRSPGK